MVFDTGHQGYVHKLLTGRMAGFQKLRQEGGVSGYPSQAESEHDIVENSHASTSLSYADGLVHTPSTAIASGTNRYLEYTFSSSRPGGISVSSMQFNFRLASAGGGNSGNGCFWFDVRSSGSVHQIPRA